jgi:hypothetical protein
MPLKSRTQLGYARTMRTVARNNVLVVLAVTFIGGYLSSLYSYENSRLEDAVAPMLATKT